MAKKKSVTERTIVSEKPAKGVRGVILPFTSIGVETPIFRVYEHDRDYRIQQMKLRESCEPYDHEAWAFKDYDIHHYDFDVEIIEDHASLYEMSDGTCKLDYNYGSLHPEKTK